MYIESPTQVNLIGAVFVAWATSVYLWTWLVSGAPDEQLDSMCNGRVIRYTSGFTAFNVGAVWSVLSERIRGAPFS